MTAPRLAWGSAAVAALVLARGLGAVARGLEPRGQHAHALVGAIVVGFAGVGALIASRHPANPIGWLFCGIGVAGALMSLSRGYAEYWLDGNSASTSLGELAASYGEVSWIPAHPPRRDLPPAPLPERALAVAPLAAGRVVRGARDRTGLRRRLHQRRPAGGLPGGREPLRRREPRARSGRGDRCAPAPRRPRRLAAVTRPQISARRPRRSASRSSGSRSPGPWPPPPS